MKYILLLVFACIAPICSGQENTMIQDPAAEKVLDRVALKFKALQSIQSDFELTIQDRMENTKNASSGHVIMKQKKYKLDSQGTTVFFDGITMWTYVTASNEVTITQPKNAQMDYFSNPLGIFSSYKNDFKYKYVKETTWNGVTCHMIDMFPKNLNQPYSRIKVYINTLTDMPEVISSIGKDGIDYTVSLKNSVINENVPDATFTFDATKYHKPEVIDMRGL